MEASSHEKKITVLCSDVSSNCFGRAYILARMLSRAFDVEIVGPAFGDGIWEPLRHSSGVSVRFLRVKGRLAPYIQILRLTKWIDGDCLYASKPLSTSFLLALLWRRGRPLVLDIDDWEMGFVRWRARRRSALGRLRDVISSVLFFYAPGLWLSTWLAERFVGRASAITVSNTFLQKRYGGEIVYHARDATAFDTEQADRVGLRQRYGIAADKKIVTFFGTPREHKGIGDLIEAVRRIPSNGVLLLLVGIDENDVYSRQIDRRAAKVLGDRYKSLGIQPFDEVANIMALSDVVAVPQRTSEAGVEQMPAKIFDAMAVGKAIVATRVSDLPVVLGDGGGWLVEAGSPEHLKEAIQEAVKDSQEAERRGRVARSRFNGHYSYDAVAPRLANVFSCLLQSKADDGRR